MSVKEGDFAQAVYDFLGESPNDLKLKVKDVVKVTEVIDQNWARGQRVHPMAEGIFPTAFVQRLHFPTIRTGQKIFLVCQDFAADQIGDLELNKGEVIVGTEAIDDSWWNGKNGPLKGMFPLSFVVELEQNDGVRSRSASCRSNSLSRTNSLVSSSGPGSGLSGAVLENPVIAQALVNVSPQLDGELAFQLGDLIEITSFMDNDWMYGRCRGKEGLVSAVCVELLEDTESHGSEITPGPSKTEPQVKSKPNNMSQPNGNYGHKDDSSRNQYDNSHVRAATGGSYTSENTRSHDAEITPYARVLYSFVAQYPSELSLKENQIVSLIQHLNADWIEGEIDGKKGMFPSGFIDIIVDCPYSYDYETNHPAGELESLSHNESTTGSQNISSHHTPDNYNVNELNNNLKNSSRSGKTLEKQKGFDDVDPVGEKSSSGTKIEAGITDVLIISEGHEIGLVLHSFQAQVDGDVSVSEGDTVEVVEKMDENWIRVQLDSGTRGVVPKNHVEIIGLWPKEEKKENNVEKTRVVTSSVDVSINTNTVNAPTKTTMNSTISKSLAGQGQSTSENIARKPKQGESDPPLPSPKAKNVTTSLPRQKPQIAPKPAIAPKPSVMKPSPKPMAAFYTAKPFSSSASSFNSHLSSPKEKPQKQMLPTLDSLIEGEISKSKSRSSSQNSTTSSDSVSSSSTPLAISTNSSPLTVQSFQPSAPITPTNSAQQLSESDPFSTSNQPNQNGRPKLTSSESVSNHRNQNERPKLISSVSLPQDSDTSTPTSSNASRRASSTAINVTPASKIVRTQVKATTPSSTQAIAPVNKSSAFVNPAFEQDVDEGVLIPNLLPEDRVAPPIRPPPRVAPPCPARPLQPPSSSSPSIQSTTSTATTVSTKLPSKLKAPPPRPTGPRLASAPSRVPLVPIKIDTKPVPLRQAPKPPVSSAASAGESAMSGLATLPANSNKENVQSLQRNEATTQSLRRPPPRPAAFPALPKRPMSMSPDLMKFSPERTTQENEEEEEEEEELDEEKKELVKDLKRRIAETLADIKKYEQTRAELRHSLQVSLSDSETGQKDEEEKEELEDKLQFVEDTLTGLKSDEDNLIENLFKLSPKEGRLEKTQLLSHQNEEEEKRRREEDALKEAELKAKRREQRSKVIQEIVETERDYLFSLQLCQDAFQDEELLPPSGVDVDFLLGNMEEIMDVSQKLLVNLESGVNGKAFEEQRIGNCFTFYFEDMKHTYAPYCRNHDSVITTMERYSENEEVSEYIGRVVEKMKEKMNVFDLAGVLIKPVQRILKYPLLLNELLKNTEESHKDKMDILLAIKSMTDVAKAINEYKRRKDLVYKYKKDTDQTFGDKLAKLNLHSIKKKSSRIRGRLSANLGMGVQIRDETFEKEEAKFQSLEKAVKIFLSSTNKYMEQSQETMRCQETLVDNIEEFFKGNQCVEATRFKEVNNKQLDLYVNMRKTLEDVVVVPLNKLVALFEAPTKVIQKRYDKCLDYNHQMGKGGDINDKPPQELLTAKNDYDAMNAQLLDELPKFYDLALSVLNQCMSAFVTARRDFMDQSLKESCALLELPSMMSKDNMMATFNIRHTTAFDHMCMLSFIPRGFNPRVDTVKSDRSRQRAKNGGIGVDGPQQIVQTSPGTQSDSQKAYLHQQYPEEKLFTVTTTHNALDVMDISLTEGMLVGVFKELDPMGNKDRWFVDDGVTKGFAPCNVLRPLSIVSAHVEEDILSIHSYDSGGGNDSVSLSRLDSHRMSNNSLDSINSLQSPQQLQALQRTSASPSPTPSSQSQQQYYYAVYDFQARHANEASLVAGNYVTVVDFHDAEGNSEWWLVTSESGHGYAPANYLAAMPYNS